MSPPVRGLDARLVVASGNGFTLDIDLAIRSGHTVALLGPNGAGKTTAVQALAGLRSLDAGRIELHGRVLDDPAGNVFVPAADRHIGVVFQDYILFPHLNVAENVSFGLRSAGVGASEAVAAARSWLDRLDIAELAERRPGDLSGGQAQRVALARALITEPAMLLLDEPLAALDVTTRARLRRTLADHLEAYEGPRLLITHDPTEAYLLADEIHLIEDGAITQVGTAEDIRLRPRTRYAADLAGSNLVTGTASAGVVESAGHRLRVGDTTIHGPVLATIHPRAISLHRNEPEGSPRNTWRTSVDRIEHYGDRVRIQTGPPMPLTAEVTPNAVDALGLHEQSSIWVSIKATEIDVTAG
ncbi:MAG: ATP-binding cassette domain-containing protein [Acidimicrobiia bacterium]|nr:ATP-binding cassette domain-containing protein [Acidimicrobiia bacterium]